MNRRKEKLASLIAELASEFIASRVDEENVFVTVTRVSISDDFKKALIFVTVYPEEKDKKVIKTLEKLAPLFRKEMAGMLTIKFIPSFEFCIDKGEKNRQRIEKIIEKLKKE